VTVHLIPSCDFQRELQERERAIARAVIEAQEFGHDTTQRLVKLSAEAMMLRRLVKSDEDKPS
jgi:hypothetical protein